MTDAEMVAAIRDLLSGVDMHRNREKRDAMQAIRELVGLDEKAPEPEPVVEPEPVAIEAAADADDLGEKDASNDSGGTWEPEAPENSATVATSEATPVTPEMIETVKRGPGRPRKTPAIAPED